MTYYKNSQRVTLFDQILMYFDNFLLACYLNRPIKTWKLSRFKSRASGKEQSDAAGWSQVKSGEGTFSSRRFSGSFPGVH